MNISDYKNCFEQGQIVEDWIWIIKNRIGPWVAQKKKHWALGLCEYIQPIHMCIKKEAYTKRVRWTHCMYSSKGV